MYPIKYCTIGDFIILILEERIFATNRKDIDIQTQIKKITYFICTVCKKIIEMVAILSRANTHLGR